MKNKDNNLSWHLEVLPFSSLKAHSKNPRQIKKEQLAHLENLITKFGMIDKPIVNKDFTIIGGHQRVKVLKRMKAKNVECWVPDRELDDREVEELMVSLNSIHGQWDWDVLANNFDPIDLLSWGFNEEQLMGHFKDPKEIAEENSEKEKKKKLKMCPSCGCEF